MTVPPLQAQWCTTRIGGRLLVILSSGDTSAVVLASDACAPGLWKCVQSGHQQSSDLLRRDLVETFGDRDHIFDPVLRVIEGVTPIGVPGEHRWAHAYPCLSIDRFKQLEPIS